MFKGIEKRLTNELKNFIPNDVEFNVDAPEGRRFGAWVGGSMISSIESFTDALLSKEYYEENGFSLSVDKIEKIFQ